MLVTQLCLTRIPGTVAHEPPLSMEFSRQEYWCGLPCPLPGDLPYLWIEPASPALVGRFFTYCATWEALIVYGYNAQIYQKKIWTTNHVYQVYRIQGYIQNHLLLLFISTEQL